MCSFITLLENRRKLTNKSILEGVTSVLDTEVLIICKEIDFLWLAFRCNKAGHRVATICVPELVLERHTKLPRPHPNPCRINDIIFPETKKYSVY